MAEAIVDAESRSDDKRLPQILDEEQESQTPKPRMQRLNNPQSLDIFASWYAFGGLSNGMTFTEIMTMPTWLRKDLLLILKVLGERRAAKRDFESLKAETKRGKGAVRK